MKKESLEEDVLNRYSILALGSMIKNEATNQINSKTRLEIYHSTFKEVQTPPIQEQSLYAKLLKMKELGLLENGYKVSRSKTYYVTKKGIELYEKIKNNK